MTQDDAKSQSLHALMTLLQIEKRLRWSNPDEARFIAVNELNRLVPYRQAILVEWDGDLPLPPRATGASGVSQVSSDSPFIRDILAQASLWQKTLPEKPEVFTLPAHAAEESRSYVGRDLLYIVPVQGGDAVRRGGLVLVRRQPLTQGEGVVLEKFSDALACALQPATAGFWRRVSEWVWSKPKRRVLIAAIVVALFMPVRATVIAPAEVVGVDPVVIRSPMQGIISTLYVVPGQSVKAGDRLLQFDEEELRARLETTGQSLAAAATELRQANVQAVSDAEARAGIAAARGKLEQQKINLEYAQEILARSTVLAPAEGVVIFDSTYNWLGRSVSIGERIMFLADPSRTHLEIRLPVQDNINLPEDARIRFFSAAAPYAPLEANLSFFSYRASMDERNVLSYRLEAKWQDDSHSGLPRLGSVGSAKIYGSYRPLVWHIMRKPFAALRAFIGI